jgi:hypothetical protein
MNPEDTFGKVYKIVAEHSGKVLDLATILDPRFVPPFPVFPPPFSKTHLIQYAFHDGDNQKFMLFPQDDGTYVIANQHTGEVLDIAQASLDEIAPCIGHSFNSQPNQHFNLRVINDSVHHIEAKHSGKVLDVFEASREDRVRVFQYHLTDGANQKFRFEVVGEYPLPAISQLGVLGSIPRATSIDDNLPAETPAVLIAEVRVPYFAVNDTLSKDMAVKISPYYLIRNEKFWNKKFDKVFEGEGRTEKYSFVSGMTEQVSHAVEATFSVEKLMKYFNLNLTFKDSTTTTTTQTVTIEREYTYKGGAPLLFVGYALVDRFTMQRTDGTVISTPWDVTNGDIFHEEAFPNAPG